jgi:polyhydroxyalkanoate synthesis regulator phasin
MGINADYVARMKTQLKQWDAELDALVARGELASAEARAASHERIAELRLSRDAAQKSLHEMRAAGEAAGKHVMAGMEETWKSMQKALKKASATLGS